MKNLGIIAAWLLILILNGAFVRQAIISPDITLLIAWIPVISGTIAFIYLKYVLKK